MKVIKCREKILNFLPPLGISTLFFYKFRGIFNSENQGFYEGLGFLFTRNVHYPCFSSSML
ncbi:hypothetical protein B4W72_06430 [Staphylococcus delphini]|uniref:Uncharacterized protein n=1 Tax=Staphylococcus delphini TaxID=53344 RepID=A0A2A4GZM0_9STAP|nr:hypothetical protein B5C08_02695 [Staphylococcus delphini]PCF63287.1 hypothetical protein B5C01_00125 [Staphylococcus delphini]PCF73550.1 hypothetical protein B4W72_06430 [Staphylococcus delphini]